MNGTFCTRLILVFSMLFVATGAIAGERWSKVRIHVPDRQFLHRLVQLGVEHEGATGTPGGMMEFIASNIVVDQLRAEGIASEVLIEDLTAFYASRLQAGPVNALGFGYGSMGGYYTLSEIRGQLDSLRLIHPEIVGAPENIGASLQGRPVWAVRMTQEPDERSTRPQVLYFAMAHPREPMGMMTLLYFMWYLAERYGQDPEVTYLLQHRDLWFIPIMNVDGYECNRRLAPNGGGMRYKNMRNVVNDADYNGVNLNCNWGAEWGYDNIGSSPIPTHYAYRGSAPFSEPETRAVRDFVQRNSFRFIMEYHAFWNLAYSVPGYTIYENEDSLIIRAYIRELIRHNRYANGHSTGMYPVNGYSSDWLYENPPALGPAYPFIVEVGNFADGNWPATSRILPLAQENVRANLFCAWAGGAFTKLQTSAIEDSSGDGDLEPGESFILNLRVRNFGQDPAAAIAVSASSESVDLVFPAQPIVIGALASQADTTVLIPGRVANTDCRGKAVGIVVNVTQGSGVEPRDTLKCTLGKGINLFSDGAEAGASNWEYSGSWGRSSIAHSGNWSFTDSPSGTYPASAFSSMTNGDSVRLAIPSGATTMLRFWTRWDCEPQSDYGQVVVSADGGRSWASLQGLRTNNDPPNSFSGWEPEWVREEMDLSRFGGQSIHLQFLFLTSTTYNADGWYVDDISITSYDRITDVPAGRATAASTYQLMQNYPNPFNPTTLVDFQLPAASDVRLVVFDLLGREVAVLVNERKAPGRYTVQFDGSSLASGVYVYRLSADDLFQAKTMTLLK